jgi:hypothetical protein
METFAAAAVTSFSEHLSGAPTGSVSLLLPAASDVISTPGTLRRAGPFSGSARMSAAKAYVNMGVGAPSYAVTAVSLSQAASGAPLDLRFTTSALPLLEGIFQGRDVGIPELTLSLRARADGDLVRYTFSKLGVSFLAEKRSASLSGTTTLVVPTR